MAMSGIPTRAFGRQGEKVSILCLGGGHIGRQVLDPDVAVGIMHRAIDEGITFFDNAWEYNEHESERRMGIAIADRRDKVFLMTKVCARDRDGAARQLDESLARLRTDHIDLWMFHEVNYGSDPDWIFGPNGAIEAAQAALRSGKIRHVGFTGHKDPSYLIRMLEMGFEWSALLMPVNVLDTGFHRSFIREVLPAARVKGVSVLGMKSVGGVGQFVTQAGMDPGECRRYALSQDISSLVVGIDSAAILEQDLAIGRSFRPMTSAEQRAFEARYAEVSGDGRYEWFKTTQYYDSRTHRDQHGFPEVVTIQGR
jgi:aryl-alcohol dehydrogenase-like predicted oxidoreductase